MEEQKPPDVGAQVRALRQQRDMSIRGLAELCELSPNTISLIERGATSPSVSTLHQLATALRVPITLFFEAQDESARVIHSRPGERSFSGSSSLLLESLGSGLEEQTLEPFLVTLKPGADSGPTIMAHEGHELVYCLQGQVEYRIEDQGYCLAPGESLLFDALLPHCWRNPTKEPAVFLLIFETRSQTVSVEQHLRP
jgi:transcriptional regulator with XRE-family HTH domain